MKNTILIALISLVFIFNINFQSNAQEKQIQEVVISEDHYENKKKVYEIFRNEKTHKFGVKNKTNNHIVIESNFDDIWIYYDKYFVLKKDYKYAITELSSLKKPFNFQPYTQWHFPEKKEDIKKENIVIYLGGKQIKLDENLKPTLPIENIVLGKGLPNESIVSNSEKLGVFNINLKKLVVPMIYDDIRVIGSPT